MRAVVSFVVGLACCACSSRTVDAEGARAPERAEPAPRERAAAKVGLPASLLGSVPAGTYGPYVGHRDGGRLVVWAAASGANRTWSALVTGGKSVATLGDAPPQLGLVVVRPTGSGHLLAYTRPAEAGFLVEARSVGAGGEPLGAPTVVAGPEQDVLWVEALAVRGGSLVLWAVRRADRADVWAASLDAAGARATEPAVVVKNARAWQVAPGDDGAIVATVTAGPEPGSPGPLVVTPVSPQGRAETKATVVSETVTADLDLDFARAGGGYVLAWSDRDRIDSRVMLAALDAGGRPRGAPRAATPGRGEQALVAVVRPHSKAGTAYLAWENLLDRPSSAREILVAPLSAEGALGAERAVIGIVASDGTVPELVATRDGLAALTLAPPCAVSQPCEGADGVPTFVRFDRHLAPIEAEPLRLDALEGEAAAMAWGLHCADECGVLAAEGSAPARVFSVTLRSLGRHWRAPARQVPLEPAPRLESLDTIAAPPPLSDVAADAIGDRVLAAWVTYFDPTLPFTRLTRPAPDGRFDPLRALLQVGAVRNDGAATVVQTLSLRARSLGGVAVAAGDPSRGEALVAWSALDHGVPQVFLTLVGKDGEKLQQRMLTRAKGEVSDVALAYLGGDSWVVGWVSERTGDPEVFTTKVNRLLMRLVPEHRVTTSPGAASDVSLVRAGDDAIIAWADARDAEQRGRSDIFVQRLRGADGAPSGSAHRIPTRLHSHSPALSRMGSKTVLAWMEDEADLSQADDVPGVFVVALDDEGKPAAEPQALGFEGAASAVGLACEERVCRLAVTSGVGGRSVLQAATWPGGSPRTVSRLSGPGQQTVPLAVTTSGVLCADQKGDQGRIRRALVAFGDGSK